MKKQMKGIMNYTSTSLSAGELRVKGIKRICEAGLLAFQRGGIAGALTSRITIDGNNKKNDCYSQKETYNQKPGIEIYKHSFSHFISLLTGFFGGIFSKSNIGKKENNKKKPKTNKSSYIYLVYEILKIINSHLFNFLSIFSQRCKHTITAKQSIVNNTGSLNTAKINIANPAAILTRKFDRTLKRYLSKSLFDLNLITYNPNRNNPAFQFNLNIFAYNL